MAAPWRFLPCASCCATEVCDSGDCGECSPWSSEQTVWADVPALTRVGCVVGDCEKYEQTVQTTTESPYWCHSKNGTSIPLVSCGYQQLCVSVVSSGSQCLLYASLSGIAGWIQWGGLAIDPDDPFDYTLDFEHERIEEATLSCSGVGTSIRVYE